MRGIRRSRAALALVAALTMAWPAAHAADDRPVFMLTESLDSSGVTFEVEPSSGGLDLRRSVSWRNDGDAPRRLEERSGLFSWGPIPPGGDLEFRPWAAGTYRFRETAAPGKKGLARSEPASFTVHPKWQGRLGLRKKGTRVRWALQRAPEGLVYDVQVLSRDGSRWRWWKRGTPRPKGQYRSKRQPELGTLFCIGFRSRIRDADDPSRKLRWAESSWACII